MSPVAPDPTTLPGPTGDVRFLSETEEPNLFRFSPTRNATDRTEGTITAWVNREPTSGPGTVRISDAAPRAFAIEGGRDDRPGEQEAPAGQR